MVQAFLHGICLSEEDSTAIPDSLLSGDSMKSTAQPIKEKKTDSTAKKRYGYKVQPMASF